MGAKSVPTDRAVRYYKQPVQIPMGSTSPRLFLSRPSHNPHLETPILLGLRFNVQRDRSRIVVFMGIALPRDSLANHPSHRTLLSTFTISANAFPKKVVQDSS